MAWRQIHDDVPVSKTLNSVSDFAERLYWRLLSQTDQWGRLPGDDEKIRAKCVPMLEHDARAIEAALDELVRVDRIELYFVDGVRYCQLLDFDEHQTVGKLKRKASAFPGPTDERSVKVPAKSSIGQEEKRREEKRTRKAVANATGEELRSSSASPRTADIRAVYDCWRTERGKTSRRFDQPSPARRAKIATRLREFTVDELCQAIRAVALDPWPDRIRHDDLVVILRSREQVERFLEFTEHASGNGHRLTARDLAERAVALQREGR